MIELETLKDVLESYMEFIDIMEKTLNDFAKMPPHIQTLSNALITKRRADWLPILYKVKSDLEKVKTE